MSKKVIEIKNIRKDFGKRTVLKDVNFDVHEKEVVSSREIGRASCRERV